MSPRVLYAVNLSLDELVTNVISYGYEDAQPHELTVDLALADGKLTVTLSDDARAFNPLLAPRPDASVPLEERRIGGWGIQFVREMMDDMQYERVGGRNVLTLQKKCQSPDGDGRS
ncbi:MAG TPA: ATP-binding protein [bacterium]|nr:ATP-binding protein [bacterium]